MNGRTNVARVDHLPLGDLVAHHVQPLGVMHDLFRDQQLAVDEPAELAENRAYTLTELR